MVVGENSQTPWVPRENRQNQCQKQRKRDTYQSDTSSEIFWHIRSLSSELSGKIHKDSRGYLIKGLCLFKDLSYFSTYPHKCGWKQTKNQHRQTRKEDEEELEEEEEEEEEDEEDEEDEDKDEGRGGRGRRGRGTRDEGRGDKEPCYKIMRHNILREAMGCPAGEKN
ncbi:hypothetical protein H671_1g3657 [Cricetulus griseus]|nr:hypothetical protein H671_1g3657 [Cricetulus griseus]